MADLTAANTILEQLGGNKFRAMTGAKDFVGDTRALQFRLPKNPKGVTNVRIELADDDTYTVKFFKIRKWDVTALGEQAMVYADSLRAVFESGTGLRTTL